MTGSRRQERLPDMILVDEIKESETNPRGADATKDANFHFLVESVSDLGILVPLLIRPIEHDQYSYELIDGERRLEAAKKVNLREVPAYIIFSDMTPEAIRDTMFHIHRNRQDWGAPEECFALKRLVEELRAEHGDDEARVIQELARRTGLHPRTARNRVQFLRWPDELQQRVYDKTVPYWFIVELEDKIIEPAQENFPLYFERVKAPQVRTMLFEKWDKGIVRASRVVRDSGIIAKYNPPDEKRATAQGHLERLVEDVEMSFEEARERFVEEFPDAVSEPAMGPRALLNRLLYLGELVSGYDEQYVLEGVGRSSVDPKGFLEGLDFLGDAMRDFGERIRNLMEG